MRHFLRSLFRSSRPSPSRRHFLRSLVGGAAVLGATSLVGGKTGSAPVTAPAPAPRLPKPAEAALDEFEPVSDPGWTV